MLGRVRKVPSLKRVVREECGDGGERAEMAQQGFEEHFRQGVQQKYRRCESEENLI